MWVGVSINVKVYILLMDQNILVKILLTQQLKLAPLFLDDDYQKEQLHRKKKSDDKSSTGLTAGGGAVGK